VTRPAKNKEKTRANAKGKKPLGKTDFEIFEGHPYKITVPKDPCKYFAVLLNVTQKRHAALFGYVW